MSLKKCPNCNSTRIEVYKNNFHCKKCGFINKQDDKKIQNNLF